MRRLAEVLGVHPTSIYNHLATKEAILDAVADAVMADAELPTEFADWREWVHELAAGMRRTARRHPRAFLVLTQRTAHGPAGAEITESALEAFRRGGFSPAQAALAVGAVSLALLGVALNECPPTAPLDQPELVDLDPIRFPRIREAWDLDVDPDAVWKLVVSSLVAGLEQR
jgi:AcrR family transcriptional regulator